MFCSLQMFCAGHRPHHRRHRHLRPRDASASRTAPAAHGRASRPRPFPSAPSKCTLKRCFVGLFLLVFVMIVQNIGSFNRTASHPAPLLESVSRSWNWKSGVQSALSETNSKRLALKPTGGFLPTTTTTTTSTGRRRRSCQRRHRRPSLPTVDAVLDLNKW